MADPTPPADAGKTDPAAAPAKSPKDEKQQAREALEEQQKQALPSNNWPGKGAH